MSMSQPTAAPSPPPLPVPLKVNQILRDPAAFAALEHRFSLPELPTRGDMVCRLTVQPNPTGFRLVGVADGALIRQCDRCLMAYDAPVHLDIDEKYVLKPFSTPHDDRGTHRDAREIELTRDDFFEEIDAEAPLDVRDLVYQLLVLEASMPGTCAMPGCTLARGGDL